MSSRIEGRVVAWTIVAVACCTVAAAARAADWKIETRIYEGHRRQPSASTTTYFHDGVYYDVLGEPPRVTMLFPATERITLVDVGRRQRAELKTEDVERLSARFRVAATRHADAAIQFAAGGKLATTFDERQQELTVGGSPLTYRVKCERPSDGGAAAEMRTFSDWCARLNSIQPGGLPARARLAVNEQLADRGLIPAGVSLTMRGERETPARTLRSEHTYVWRLSPDDLRRISSVRSVAEECKEVSLRRYLGFDANVERSERGDRRTAGRQSTSAER